MLMAWWRSPIAALDDAPSGPRQASIPHDYWAVQASKLLAALHSSPDGLGARAAALRLKRYGPNLPGETRRLGAVRLFLRQYESPLILILVAAAAVAALVRDWTNAVIVLLIVLGSGVLSFAQEYRASTALEKLRAKVRITCTVLRGGKAAVIPSSNVVPGDIVLLSAGSLIPADGVLLDAKDFFVSQAVLTGESFPTEKMPGVCPSSATVTDRTNCAFMGTSVRNGTARMLVINTGARTIFGDIAGRLRLRPPETEFERGVRRYGYLLTQLMLLLVLVVFAANILLHRAPIESLLFAIALAVGLSPELLPAIISITLSQGARQMAAHGVIVRRLSAIENLGSMDVLCSDKTGTLTEGVMNLDATLDFAGQPSAEALHAACLNAALQTGLANPLDEAIVARGQRDGIDIASYRKLDEIPYDFVRKRLSVLVQGSGAADHTVLITKGALSSVLQVCASVQSAAKVLPLEAANRDQITELFTRYSRQGYRVLGVARKPMPHQAICTRADETSLVFLGFLLFLDPPKDGIQQTLASLAGLGIQLKVITGDNPLVAAHLAESVGMASPQILSGHELDELHDEALWHLAERTDVFAEIDPNQKERIVLALKKRGHVVGYLGDGINDAPALHAADVGISVNQAVDVAKSAADFVLLEHDLDVLRQGVEQGRKTFANTFKYIAITTSANFGNMISMAAASLFLPFLPLLAKQILLNNFLSDFPAMTIATDNVDPELVQQPRRWEISYLRNFMLVFGSISSFFDFVTFGILLWVLHAPPELFRTAWFVESLLTELAIVLVVRTYRPFYRSKPGRMLWISTVVMVLITVILPYLPGAGFFDLVPLSPSTLAILILITLLYVAASEVGKRLFYSGRAKPPVSI
jgi:Mg2+-importing ATPase